jgi:hypothetical protein
MLLTPEPVRVACASHLLAHQAVLKVAASSRMFQRDEQYHEAGIGLAI